MGAGVCLLKSGSFNKPSVKTETNTAAAATAPRGGGIETSWAIRNEERQAFRHSPARIESRAGEGRVFKRVQTLFKRAFARKTKDLATGRQNVFKRVQKCSNFVQTVDKHLARRKTGQNRARCRGHDAIPRRSQSAGLGFTKGGDMLRGWGGVLCVKWPGLSQDVF